MLNLFFMNRWITKIDTHIRERFEGLNCESEHWTRIELILSRLSLFWLRHHFNLRYVVDVVVLNVAILCEPFHSNVVLIVVDELNRNLNLKQTLELLFGKQLSPRHKFESAWHSLSIFDWKKKNPWVVRVFHFTSAFVAQRGWNAQES